jgi:hypothetical protein
LGFLVKKAQCEKGREIKGARKLETTEGTEGGHRGASGIVAAGMGVVA